MSKALLKRLPPDLDYENHYEIHGYPNLRVEPNYSDEDYRRPELMYWTVRDIRFSPGLDRWSRWMVLLVPKLSDVRSWPGARMPSG